MKTFYKSRKTILTTIIAIQLLVLVPVIFNMLVAASPLAPLSTQVSGNITTNTTWTVANSPYVITESVFVAQGVTLTIESGVEVRGQVGTNLQIDGHLDAVGTAVNPITFTSDNDVEGGWFGIFVEDDGSAVFDHAIIEKGDTNLIVSGGPGGAVLLENSQLVQSATYPIHLYQASTLHRLQMSNVTFINNAVNRVFFDFNEQDDELVEDLKLTFQLGLDGYEIPFHLIVPSGITLTIDPGVTVMATGSGYAMVIINEGAHFEVIGTSLNPITFTSVSDSGPGDWASLAIEGSAHFQHVNFCNSVFNLDINGSMGGSVVIEDSLISRSTIGLAVSVGGLHRLQMSNVTFADNAQNRVRLIQYDDDDQLSGNVTLKPMPGLEGYEYYIEDGGVTLPTRLRVPEGITLTLYPDSTLMMAEDSTLYVEGHLLAVGEIGHFVTFKPTGDILSDPFPAPWTGIVFVTTGTGNLSYANIQEAGIAVGVFGTSDRLVFIENSVFANGYYGADANLDSLHRLQMADVAFESNTYNRIAIDVSEEFDTFADDIVLIDQPGLEGYQFILYEPPILHNEVHIPEGLQLRMDPGSTLLMPDGMKLVVDGEFEMSGSANQTSSIRSEIISNLWQGVVLRNGGSAILNHGQLMDAETAVSLQSPSSTLTITNTTLTQNGTGILANSGTVTATCAILSNNTHGIKLDSSGTGEVNIHQSSLSGNASAGINNEGTSLINAVNNWWGAADGPSGDGSGSGDAVFGNVLYEPWQEAFDCAVDPNGTDEWTVFLPMVIKSKSLSDKLSNSRILGATHQARER